MCQFADLLKLNRYLLSTLYQHSLSDSIVCRQLFYTPLCTMALSLWFNASLNLLQCHGNIAHMDKTVLLSWFPHLLIVHFSAPTRHLKRLPRFRKPTRASLETQQYHQETQRQSRMSSSDYDDLSMHCGLDDARPLSSGFKASLLGSSFTVLFNNLTGYRAEKTKQGHLLARDDDFVEISSFPN